MTLVPGWAPNLHPLVIHFPIVLLILAAVVDLVDVLFERPAWLRSAATILYGAGAAAAVAAYLTGLQAAATVFVPGMAHPLVADHQTWALVTTLYFSVLAAVRLAALLWGAARARPLRWLLLTLGLTGVVALQQTAERGARLVYEHGVGVIASPPGR